MTDQRILITGGAGFIGSPLALRLVERGHFVRVLDTLAPQIHGSKPEESPLYRSIVGRVEFMRGSVTIRSDMMRALPDIDTVVHLAAETGTGQSMYAIQHYSDVNIGGTALMLDLIANSPFPVRKIVVASSRAVYGEGKYECPLHGIVYPSSRSSADMERGDFELHCSICGSVLKMLATDEKSVLSPISVYGVTKLTQEQLVLTIGQSLGISAVAYRYQNVYGPGQSLANPYTGILSIFSTRIRHGSPINIFEDGTESRDFVYIDDVIAATLSGIEHDGTIVDSFNVGSGVATEVTSVVNKLQEIFGKTVPVTISGQFRVGDIRHNVADLSKIRQTLGFAPTVSIGDGLLRFAEWVQGEAIQADRYEESLAEMRAKGLFK